MSDLFDSIVPLTPPREVMAEGALLLRGAALPFETDILTAIQAITAMSPFRHMVTPGGFLMSVAMTNCGAAGWVTDRSGYRYDALDPESGKSWPPMPASFFDIPPCVRDDLQREPWAFVSDALQLDDLVIYQTSGTTGHPLDILTHPEPLAMYVPLLRAALATLPDEQRKPIELGFFGGVTHEEIARTTSIPLGTIKTRIRSGLRRLREELSTSVSR